MLRNKSNGGVRSSKNRVERWLSDCFDRVNAQQENRQFGILLEDRQRLRGLGLALAGMRVAVAWALAMVSAACVGVGGGLDFLRLRFAGLFRARLMSTCRSEVMRAKTVCVTLSGRPIFLKPRNSS
jgi:hypothetical protein